MRIVRFITVDHPGGVVGVLDGDRIHYCVSSLGELLELRCAALAEIVESATHHGGYPNVAAQVLAPADADTEVWAAGVTYGRSREARIEESTVADIYTRVYDAQRPELFIKATGWRVVTDQEPIAIRRDSELNVPEPELGLVINAHAEVIGYMTANDVSSRSIEAENPLYLPQAKVYSGSCALGAQITPSWMIAEPGDLNIRCDIERNGTRVWSAQTSTSQMHRPVADLIDTLFAETDFPRGVILLTGTGVVPDLDTCLEPGDIVTVDIAGIGRLTNPVVRGKAQLRLSSQGGGQTIDDVFVS